MSRAAILFRVFFSLIFGGLFYFVWMAIFLLSSPDGGLMEAFLWLIAPITTGLGFAIGIILFSRIIDKDEEPFEKILIWPLIGCSLGAVSVYWFGPMLIVFSMLAFGTASIVIREIVLRY